MNTPIYLTKMPTAGEIPAGAGGGTQQRAADAETRLQRLPGVA
jgi:hypothetical protein